MYGFRHGLLSRAASLFGYCAVVPALMAIGDYGLKYNVKNNTALTVKISTEYWNGSTWAVWTSQLYMDPGEERVVDQREYVSTGISVRVRYSEGPSYSSWIVADPSQATFTGISQQWVTINFQCGSSVVTKRLRECVKNTQDYAVTAYWKKNGTVVYSKILMPGQQECYTFTYQSDETVTLESGFTKYDWGMTDYGPGLVQLTNWNDLDETQSSTSTNPPPYLTNSVSGRDRTPYTQTSLQVQQAITFGTNLTDRQASELAAGATVAAIRDGDDKALAELQRIRMATEVLTNRWGVLPDPTNSAATSRSGAEGDASDLWDLEGATIGELTDGIEIPGTGTGSAGLSTSINIRDRFTLNANPLQSSIASPLITGIRAALIWVIAIWVCWQVFHTLEHSFLSVMQAPQGTTVGQSVAGFNVSLPSALIVAGIIVAVVAAAFVLLVTYFKDLWPGTDPITAFANLGTVCSTAVAWADSLFPLRTALAAIVTVFVARVTVLVTTGVQAGAIRLLTGV